MTRSKVTPMDSFFPSRNNQPAKQTEMAPAPAPVAAGEGLEQVSYDDIGLTLEEMAGMEDMFLDRRQVAAKRRGPRAN